MRLSSPLPDWHPDRSPWPADRTLVGRRLSHAHTQAQGLTKELTVSSEEPGLLNALRSLLVARVQGSPGPWLGSASSLNRVRWLLFSVPMVPARPPRLRCCRASSIPTAARPGAGLRAVGAGRRLPPPLRPGHGAEEPALVGPARRRQFPAPSGNLFRPPGCLRGRRSAS